ncbi:MAG: cache domain-containing protein, partial [Zetaproteobacteria bacterium]|nr:cache domain-containing protein [Zetaproteobacteria bacterium]
EIIESTNFIALNASIEAARTQNQSENFSLVADQVKRQAEKMQELAENMGEEVSALQTLALHAISVNYTDMANDIIDKIDRNLFERNCDMQAWAGFEENVHCAKVFYDYAATKVMHMDRIRQGLSANEKPDEFSEAILHSIGRLSNLTDIYNVYFDVLLLNNKGVVISVARREELIGSDLSHEEYFQYVVENDDIHVSDCHYDRMLKEITVNYSAPVHNEQGQVIGVISTRFNWHYVLEMIEKFPISETGEVYIIQSDGTVIGNKEGKLLLRDNLHWLRACQNATQKKSGYSVECARNGETSAFGFCHTFGYNAYAGKEWSAIVMNSIELKENKFLLEAVTRETEGKKQSAALANEKLESVSSTIQSQVRSINTINNETNMLAVNAAIQAGVAGAEGEAFSVIASEIGQLARQSEKFVNNINGLTSSLSASVHSTVYDRLGVAAFDTIDKIDRNLYERYCDVQAYASFDKIRSMSEEGSSFKDISVLLKKLHEIYEVYHDIMITDMDGNIVAAAVHRELLGQNQADRSWFRDCSSGNIVVTDLYYSKSINDYTVTFAAPIRDSDGAIIGVMNTRFNCEFVYDIMKSTIVSSENMVYLINSKGVVIGSPDGDGILEESFAHLKAFRQLNKKSYGYVIEEDEKDRGQQSAIGFSKTQGYLTYKGKGWSVMIKRAIV